jgi:hypothetical protein
MNQPLIWYYHKFTKEELDYLIQSLSDDVDAGSKPICAAILGHLIQTKRLGPRE